ncbi:Hypothetical protein SMAX5B_016262, partial [Scophthalmus maximus]
SGNRRLPGSLSVQIVLEADSATARAGSEEAAMAHVGQEVVEYEQGQLSVHRVVSSLRVLSLERPSRLM